MLDTIDTLKNHSEPVSEIQYQFEIAFKEGKNPSVESFLKGEGLARQKLLFELLHSDLELRLRAGQSISVKDYLSRYTELTTHPGILVELLKTEIRVLKQLGKQPQSEEYESRYGIYLGTRLKDILDVATRLPRHPDLLIGTVIGKRYKITSSLGQGGMGTVYLAEQLEPVRRQVALKVIKSGIDSRSYITRFEAERQALAMMDHPNIARVYDGGTTENSQPFYVMELVQGIPVTQYCDQQRLSPRVRLELFVLICQAVQHAHQKGIIHRDLKPGNVLVTTVDGKSTPKVIDFGLAKAIEQRLTDETIEERGAVGTPAYMSPEQADPGLYDVDTRTDVYALGVILYELLTGSTPIDASQLRHGAQLEMLRMVRETDPPKPSTKLSSAIELPSIAANRDVEPKQLLAWVRGDIDWMVMKALEKNRNHRYESASAFADDISRYLVGEPVHAHPPSKWYQVKKFVRRNKMPVAAAVLVIASLIGGLSGVVWGYIKTLKEETAQQKSLQAKTQREFLLRAALENGEKCLQEKRYADAVKESHRMEAVLNAGDINNELARHGKQFTADVRTVSKMENARIERRNMPTCAFNYEKESPDTAFREYGIDILNMPQDKAVALIKASRIREELISTIDDWCWVIQTADSESQQKIRKLLLSICQAADENQHRVELRKAIMEGGAALQERVKQYIEQADILDETPSFLLLLANVLIKTEQHTLAIQLLKRTDARYPGNFWINLRLAEVYEQMRDPQIDSAIQHYYAARMVQPSTYVVTNNLVALLSYKKDLETALDLQREYAAKQPEDCRAQHHLGILYSQLDKTRDQTRAIKHYKELLEKWPDYTPSMINYSGLLANAGRVKEALPLCQRAVVQLNRKASNAKRDRSDYINMLFGLSNLMVMSIKTGIPTDATALLDQNDPLLEDIRKLKALNRVQELSAADITLRYHFMRALVEEKRLDSDTEKAILHYTRALEIMAVHQEYLSKQKDTFYQALKSSPDLKLNVLRLYKKLLSSKSATPVEWCKSQQRFHAATVAVATSTLNIDNKRDMTSSQAMELRKQALTWLQDDLPNCKKLMTTGGSRENAELARSYLELWLQSPAFNIVRDEKEWKLLAESERIEWTALWHEIRRELAVQPSNSMSPTKEK